MEFLWLLILLVSLQINEPLSLTINKPIALPINELTKIFSIKQILKGEGRRQIKEVRKTHYGDALGSMLRMQTLHLTSLDVHAISLQWLREAPCSR